MAEFSDLQLKQWFETADFPTQQQFFNFIDSKLHINYFTTDEKDAIKNANSPTFGNPFATMADVGGGGGGGMAINGGVTGSTNGTVLFIQSGQLADDPTKFDYVSSNYFVVKPVDSLSLFVDGSTYAGGSFAGSYATTGTRQIFTGITEAVGSYINIIENINGSTGSDTYLNMYEDNMNLVSFDGTDIVFITLDPVSSRLINYVTDNTFISQSTQTGSGWEFIPGILTNASIFAIKHQTNSMTLYDFKGDGTFAFRDYTSNQLHLYYDGTTASLLKDGGNFIEFGSNNRIFSSSLAFQIDTQANRFYVTNSGTSEMTYYKGVLMLGTYIDPSTAFNAILVANVNANPAANVNSMWVYSKDQVAGNACFHTKTELGDELRLFKQTLTDSTTGTAGNSLVDVGIIFSQSNINNNFATIHAKLSNLGLW